MGNCQTISEEGDRKSVTKFGGKPQIMIKTYTWARDSHGLFDYESKNLTKKSMKTSNPGRVVRQGNEVRLAKENDKLVNKEEKELLKLFLKEGSVYVDNCKEVKDQPGQKAEEALENIDYDLWLVIKSMKNQMNNKGYKLSESDLIKLGRIKFRIRELRGFASKATKCEKQTKIEDDISIAESEKKSCGTPKGSQSSLQQTCRICLSESADSSDPFFSPCNCTGTMKYIHVKCLQRWLKSKLHMKQSTGSISIYWKTLECELCKTPYPTSFIVDEKRYDVVEFDRPECPYIILDILSKDKSVTKGIHILKMENKTNIRLGRGHDSDIRITDISVSRCHAFIKLDKGEFYIDDNNSKFGTLVHLKKAFSVPFDYTDVSLQIGRTLVALTVKRGRKIFGNCFKPPVENYNTSNDEKSSESEEEEDGDNHAQNVAESPSIQRQRTDNNQQARHRPEATYIRRDEPEAEEEFEEPEENEEGEEEEEEEEEQEQIENNDRSEGNVTENVNAVQHHVNSPPQSQRNNSMSQNNNNHNNNNVAELPQIENHHELRPNQPRQPNPDQQSVQSANQTE